MVRVSYTMHRLDRLRSWLAAGGVLTALVTASTVPAWQDKLETGYHQVRLLPQRLVTPVDEMQRQTLGDDFEFVALVRSRTFEDAVILVSQDPRDGRLSSEVWLAYFLYPRVLVQPSERNPDVAVDFIMTTPHFDPSGGSNQEPDEGHGLVAVSDRARDWGRVHWNR